MTSTIVEQSASGVSPLAPLLSLRKVNKKFGAVQVLTDVDLDVYPGMVTALVGDNGAGKSTLIKGIAGIHAFDSGEYIYEGEEVTVHDPRKANDLGIEVVYQDLALSDNLDVVHNMYLGRELRSGIVLDEIDMERRATETLSGLSVRTLKSVRQIVASLSGGQRQTVAIARAVLWNSKLVILDEPTAALGVAQTEQVLNLVRRLADRGLGVVLISHNLNDVKAVADRIAVLYLGTTAAQVNIKDVTNNQVVELITGGRTDGIEVGFNAPYKPSAGHGGSIMTAPVTSELPTPAEPSVAPATSITVRESLQDYTGRIRGGDLGSLPATLGLIALVIVFTILQGDTFFNVGNFANLINQSAGVIVIAIGLIFVLLLGEIDLAAGYAAGTCGAIMAVQLTDGRPWPVAVGLCLLAGAFIGLLIGLLVARLGIPSFVVTLAFFLGLQGVQLIVIGEGGTIPVNNEAILAIMNENMPIALGWALYAVVVVGYGGVTLLRIRGRRRAGLTSPSLGVWAAKAGTLAVLLFIGTALLSRERAVNPELTSIKGVPWVVPVILVLLVVLTFVLQQTRFGRHIYAVGGNAEAARRAGIDVKNLRTVCFVICSTLAAFAGVLLVSRDNSVSPSTGGSVTLLFAVAAAVIGGTSLFGGRGRIKDAILGGLVLAVIGNGLPLVTSDAGIQYVVTGLALLLAASVDALSRKRGAATGRA